MHLNTQHGISSPNPNIYLSWYSLIYPRETNILEARTSTQSIFKQSINYSTKALNKHVHKSTHVKQLNQKACACSLPSAGDRSNIILGVLRLNHQERGKFKENVIKKKKTLVKMKNNFFLVIVQE